MVSTNGERKMKKKTGAIILSVLLSFSLVGCGGGTTPGEGGETVTETPIDADASVSAIEAPVVPSASEVTGWADNGSDLYIGTANTMLLSKEWEGLTDSAHNYLLNGAQGGLFEKYFFEDHTRDSEWLCLIDVDGTCNWRELDAREYGARGMAMWVGGMAGGGGYVVQAVGEGDTLETIQSKILLLDEELQLIGSFDLDGLIDYYYMQADASGNVAFVKRLENRDTVCSVLDQEGRTIWEKTYSYTEYDSVKWIPFPDGTLGLYVMDSPNSAQEGKERGVIHALIRPDLETGGDHLVARTELDIPLLFLCPFDEDTLLYADAQGLYICDMDFGGQELIYRWANHGVGVKEIRQMGVLPGGEISMVYASADGDYYLHLKPNTGDAADVIEIPFIMSEANRREYQEAVVAFNRTYPSYALTLVEYEDETVLLTELNAGAGPVLVDTDMLSFELYTELWEDLGERLAGAGLSNALLEKVMAAGQISGRQYGIVPNWQMITFVSAVCQEESWDYQGFKDYVTANPQLRMIHREQTPASFMQEFFLQDLKNSSFVDWDAGQAYFDSPEFSEILALSERYAVERLVPTTRSEVISMMREGSCLGEVAYILGPESLAYYDAMLGEGANYIGFPGPDGSRNYISAASPLTIRASATEEQKQGAFLFLELLLEYQTQKDMVAGSRVFSVRQDVFEEQLENMDEEVTYTVDGEPLTIDVDAEDIKWKLLDLYEDSVPYPSLPPGLREVVSEELQSFFSGQKSAKDVCAVLQNRVQLYLNERGK